MSGRKTKHTARGFLNAASRIVSGARSPFQESSSSQSRQEALLRHVRPELRDTPIALQRSIDVNVHYIYDMTSLCFCYAANGMTRISTTEVTIDRLIKSYVTSVVYIIQEL
jgi:hypothetical protein